MWCAMNEARGLNMVKSLPRSFILASWLSDMESRNSSSLICKLLGSAMTVGSVSALICTRLRHRKGGGIPYFSDCTAAWISFSRS
jgi:hypothetical protein